MATKNGGLSRVWEAVTRRDAVLSAHPHLRELETDVAKAIKRYAAGQCDDKAVRSTMEARHLYLERHGIPLEYAEPQWACATCQDEGYIQGAPCVCRQQAELDRIVASSNLPSKLRQQTFDKFELKWYSTTKKSPQGVTERTCARDALRSCQAFVARVLEGRADKGLFVSGGVGLGKTFLLSAICNSLTEASVPTLYVVFSDLIAAIRDSFNPESTQSESRIMAATKEARVLILDDLGAEHSTDFVTNRLFDIINFRCNHSLPLVVSSNLGAPQIAELYGPRIASRLLEMCEPVTLVGEDIRWQKQH
ncbi:MAG: Primosomal protein DnaI [Firmicutes bacterium]|nr:Primosomal protein DnaI [Bacillota bacterium]